MTTEEFCAKLRSIRISAEYADDTTTMGAVDRVAFPGGCHGFPSAMGWELMHVDRILELRRKAGEL